MSSFDDHTPMMQQYLRIKADHPHALVFYRMGDFFELFFDDARAAAPVLDIALTRRGKHGDDDVPMCGVPVHSAEMYLARLIRAEVLHADSEDYVTAARALGARPTRIFWRHILPNAVGPVLVSSVFGVASVVLLEAAISFLAMGAPTRVASWGETLAEGAHDPAHLRLILLPGFLLLATVGGPYLLADAVRDAIDPRAARLRAR